MDLYVCFHLRLTNKRHMANILFREAKLVFSRFEVRLLMVELDVSGRMRFANY